MAAGAQTQGWSLPSRRRVPRYRVQAPLDVTVLRSGIPDTLPGRSVDVCERGIAAVLSGELTPGERVGLEVHLPSAAVPLRTRALVRYCDRLRCGMEFLGLSAAQQAAIRNWAELSGAPPVPEASAADGVAGKVKEGDGANPDVSKAADSKLGPSGKRSHKRRRPPWTVLLIAATVLAAILWWRWNRGWEELESGLARSPVANSAKERVHVPAEVMEKLLIHRVDPEYPAAARPARLQGVIVLDVVIGPDGSVVQTRPLNGPEILSRAAVEALRWWKFQPYRVNGQAVEVETTVAMEFRSPMRTSQ